MLFTLIRDEPIFPGEETRISKGLFDPDLCIVSTGLLSRAERQHEIRRAKAFDIAFGDVVVNESKYMKIDTFLINNVDFDFEIKNIKITGENARDFEIIDNSIPFQLNANQIKPIFIKFTPSK